jgi:hypothetical protein
MNPPPPLDWPTVIGLLAEAREHICDKPWDERTLLHARISRALGLPVEYPDTVERMEQERVA